MALRLFTVLVLTLGWESTTIDYTNAFTQAPLHSPCWIRLPLGFGSTASGATCLKLKKTLYGSSCSQGIFLAHLMHFAGIGIQTISLRPLLAVSIGSGFGLVLR